MAISTSYNQDKKLAGHILDNCTLTVENGEPSLALDAGVILEFISEEYAPDDVFDAEFLNRWATANGYVKADEESI